MSPVSTRGGLRLLAKCSTASSADPYDTPHIVSVFCWILVGMMHFPSKSLIRLLLPALVSPDVVKWERFETVNTYSTPAMQNIWKLNVPLIPVDYERLVPSSSYFMLYREDGQKICRTPTEPQGLTSENDWQFAPVLRSFEASNDSYFESFNTSIIFRYRKFSFSS